MPGKLFFSLVHAIVGSAESCRGGGHFGGSVVSGNYEVTASMDVKREARVLSGYFVGGSRVKGCACVSQGTLMRGSVVKGCYSVSRSFVYKLKGRPLSVFSASPLFCGAGGAFRVAMVRRSSRFRSCGPVMVKGSI